MSCGLLVEILDALVGVGLVVFDRDGLIESRPTLARAKEWGDAKQA
jgi:hypothetical protein